MMMKRRKIDQNLINWFLEMFGYREFIEIDEYRDWKRSGIAVNRKDLKTELMPSNVEREEVIREVLLCYRGQQTPIDDLLWNQALTCPEMDPKRLIRVAGRIVATIAIESNKKATKKDFEPAKEE